MIADRRPWYREWFGEAYAELYPHRDEEEARRAVALVDELCPEQPRGAALDLACGGGRHLPPLRSHGWRPTGLDLSPELLGRARRRTEGEVPLVRGDMRRIPLSDASFALVTQFFTSFGYFERPAEDVRVLEEVRRVLRAGGHYFLDFLNAGHVRRHLVPEDTVEVDGRTVRQVRAISEGTVRKRIEVDPDAPGGPARVFHERVRLWEPDELEAAMAAAGLTPVARRGDYEGGAFRDDAPRLLVLARAA